MSTTHAKTARTKATHAKTTSASAQSSSPLDLAIIGSGPAALSAALCLLLGGCLANPFARTPAPEEPVPAAPLSPVPQFIAMNNAGAQASIDDPAFGGMVDVMVEGSFTSASGRDCRRAVVSRPPHEAEIVILCRNGETWELMPRVWGRGLD